MPKSSVGSRVMALASCSSGVAVVFGEGVFVGEEVPDGNLFPHLKLFADHGIKNPKIVLDSGDVIWGCECWWGPVDSLKERIAGCSIENITPAQYRGSMGGEADADDEGIQSL